MTPRNSRWFKILARASVAALGIVGIFVGAFVWLVSGFADGLCGNSPLAEISSPNGSVRAVIFERNCGATTGFSTQVSVLGIAEKLPEEAGNLFVATTDYGKAPSGTGGGPEVQVAWVSSTVLRINHHSQAKIIRAETSLRSIRVEYTSARSDG